MGFYIEHFLNAKRLKWENSFVFFFSLILQDEERNRARALGVQHDEMDEMLQMKDIGKQKDENKNKNTTIMWD